jgi:glycosyltransferase involved in cell wall biosynthesis
MRTASSSALAEANPRRRRVAVVVPYCGSTVYGGASALALAVAKRLDRHFDVEVLTTCALDYETWRNALPEGHDRVDGVHVRRFPVDRERDRATFERLSRVLVYDGDATLDDQERWMRAQGPYSSPLLEYLDLFGARYDAVLFFSYLYATTYFGLPLVEDRAILAPLAHDEWPIAFSMWDRFFTRPGGFVFVSAEEREFVRGRFPALAIDGPVAGIGIVPPVGVSAERFRAATGIAEPFALYVGRIDPSKGCDELLADFAAYRAGAAQVPRLVLVGERHMHFTAGPEVTVVGPVDERTKWDALAACDVFVMPSPHESLSISVLEAWTQGRTVFVNGRSATLVGQCRRAGGGLWYTNADEFAVGLEMLDPETRRRMGESGRRYVREQYSWERVEQIYVDVVMQLAGSPA